MLRLAADATLTPGRFAGPLERSLIHVRLDAVTAIYDRRSGMTHLVAAPVPEVLRALGDGEADADELAQRLDAVDERDALIERLHELVATGLVSAS